MLKKKTILIVILICSLLFISVCGQVDSNRIFAKDSIQKKAIEVTKEVENYLQAHPQETLNELLNDPDFKKIAVQPVGKTGYTYIIIKENGLIGFHPDQNVVGKSYNYFKNDYPLIWNIINKNVNLNECRDSSGFYQWPNQEGILKDKYTYHHCANIKTADNYTLIIGASTYIEEYEQPKGFSLIYIIIISVLSVLIILSIMLGFNKIKLKNIKQKRTLKNKLLVLFLISSILPLFIFGTILIYTNYSTIEGLNNDIIYQVEESINSNINQELIYLTKDITHRLNEQLKIFKLINIDDKAKQLLEEADKTGEISNDHFYPEPKSKEWYELQERFKDIYNTNKADIDMIRIFDHNGYIVNGIVYDEEDSSDYKGDKSWFKDAMKLNLNKNKNNPIYISPISKSRKTNSSTIRYALPINPSLNNNNNNNTNNNLGLFVINFKSNSITDEIQNYNFGDNSFAVLIDLAYENDEGQVLNHPVILAKTTEQESYEIDENEENPLGISGSELKDAQGRFELKIDHVNYYAYYKQVIFEDKQWYVIIFSDQEEIFYLPHYINNNLINLDIFYRNAFIILLLIFSVSAIIASFLVSNSITKPIINLSLFAEELGQGNFSNKVDIKTGDELEKLGETLNDSAKKLANIEKEHQQIEEAKTRFLSITSHELRSPMTPMKAQLQMLESGYYGRLNDKQKESINIIIRNADRLDKIIVDFLEISRIEAARLKFEFKKTNLNETVKEVVDYMKGFMPEKNIKIINYVKNLPIIEVDPDRVSQVLRNFINNAIKFSPENRKIEIFANVENEMIKFSIKDYGIGIKPEDQQKIFEPFYQAEQSIYRKSGGTGLGLAICRGIVESQNGRIEVNSKLGKGTTFSFTWPLKPVKEIKPIKILFSSSEKYETKLKDLFKEMLGPLGEKEFESIKQKGVTKENIIRYINILKDRQIIEKEVAKIFINKLSSIFGGSSEKSQEKEKQTGAFFGKSEKKKMRDNKK